LVEANNGIDHNDGQNDDRILDIADEHKDQDALELAKKHQPA
jgi:hypothetical protein